ncbi:MAG: VCBS repeat-containing protein [Sandaracinaceae bacterium]|nr:VCBS repeat-containing protein [Sandaracinaceae bacterium]
MGVRWAWVAPLGWMLVMGLFAGGCGPSDGTLDLGMDSATEDLGMADTSVPDAGPTLTPCASNVECAGGEVCRTGFCRTSCTSASECTGALSVCDEDAGYCVGCTLDEHCGANEACVDHSCDFFCRGNTACDADEYCVLATGACAERECELSNQCPGGFRCDSFLCVPIDDIVCVADSVTCSGENTAVLRCNADGTMEAMEACDVGTRCVAEAGAATCDAILCEANELGCADNATAFVCDATGTVRTDTDCGAGRYCASGACQDQVCTPSSVTCMGAGVLSCDALGAAETFEACSARAECSGSSFGCSCASGSCMTRVCLPASTRCAVTGFQTCSTDGLSWGNVTGCAMDETCVPALGTCAPVLCTANSRECMTDVLVACDATGTVRTTTNCAASSQICTGSGPSAACTARVCVPGSLACNTGFDAVLECDARGASLSTTACPSGDYCSAGGCVAEVCTPGSLSRCLAGDVRQCNAIGSAYQLMDDCTASETCVENASGGACVAHVCTPSAVSCTGDDLVSCAANGLSQSTTDCQAVMSYCSAGACLPWVCTPGSVDCTGTGATATVATCDARGAVLTQTMCGGTLGCDVGGTACNSVPCGGTCETDEFCSDNMCSTPTCGAAGWCDGSCDSPRTAQPGMSGSSEMQGWGAGDINGDGHDDVWAIYQLGNRVDLYHGNGAGGFAAPVVLATGRNHGDSTYGDFNEDGRVDMIFSQPDSSQYRMLIGSPSGLVDGGTIAQASTPRYVDTIDYNHDGHLDLLIYLGGSSCVRVRTGNGNGTFAAASACLAGIAPDVETYNAYSIVVFDWDGDGFGDIAAVNDTMLRIHRTTGSGTTLLSSIPISTPAGVAARAVDVVSLRTANGVRDVIAIRGVASTSSLELVRPDGAGGHRIECRGVAATTSASASGMQGLSGLAADFDEDGFPDRIWRENAANVLHVDLP